MPAKVKLLNAAPGGTTGAAQKVGTGMPPFTIRTDGGYIVGAGPASTNGVNVEFSSDGGVTWARCPGLVGGTNVAAAGNAETVDLPDRSLVSIPFYAGGHVRALTGANMTGAATVYFEFPR